MEENRFIIKPINDTSVLYSIVDRHATLHNSMPKLISPFPMKLSAAIKIANILNKEWTIWINVLASQNKKEKIT